MSSIDGLWAITAYFNPLRYRRRLANYKVFRERLDVPLVAVEAVYDEPELGDSDAEILIRRRCEGVLWQKERLLNIALEALPSSCDRVVVLDADVVFANADWVERLKLALDQGPLCQPFRLAHHLPRDHELDAPLRGETPGGRSLASWVADGTPIGELLGTRLDMWQQGCCPGLAWAAHRSLLARHGMLDICILGGACSATAFASQGEFDLAEEFLEMSPAMRASYRAWAEPFYADVRGHLGFADNTVLHLWHGELTRRRYRERHAGLVPFGFDPATDLVASESGCLAWATDKPEMHDYVYRYFKSRCEDG